MIPLKCINILQKEFSSFSVNEDLLERIKPGKSCDHGIEVICNGILKGEEFIFKSEKYN